MRSKLHKQSSPEDFWKVHLRRHNSTSNISNQLYNECVNQDILFLTHRIGQFSSLENLSKKIYQERKDNQFYVKKKSLSQSVAEKMEKCGLPKKTDMRDMDRVQLLPNEEFSLAGPKQIKMPIMHNIHNQEKQNQLGENMKHKSKTINKIIKSFSLKRRKDSQDMVYLEVCAAQYFTQMIENLHSLILFAFLKYCCYNFWCISALNSNHQEDLTIHC